MTEPVVAEAIPDDAEHINGGDTTVIYAAVVPTAGAAETVDATSVPLTAVDAAPTTAAPHDEIVAAEPGSDAVVPAASGRKHAKRTVALHTGYVGTGYFGKSVA